MTLENYTSGNAGNAPRKGSGKMPAAIFGLVIIVAIVGIGYFLMREPNPVRELSSSMTATGCESSPESGDVSGNVSFGQPINWSQPNRAEVPDGNYAQISLGPNETGKYLSIQDYDLNIPASAVVEGIQIDIWRFSDATGAIQDSSVRLITPGGGGGGFSGTITGTEHAQAGNWPSVLTQTTYGGPTDLWGVAWTAADVNHVDFGMVIAVTQNGGSGNIKAYIDYITITIFHDGGLTGCAMPVEWGDVNATEEADHSVAIAWSTASEKSNVSFNPERSSDGENFEAIGDVPSTGDSESSQAYSFNDNQPLEVTAFYRIRQIDMDGNSSYSSIVEFVPQSAEVAGLKTVYPNPVNSGSAVKFDFESANTDHINVELYDINGRVFMIRQYAAAMGNASYELPSLDVPPGTYILGLVQGSRKYDFKIIVRP